MAPRTKRFAWLAIPWIISLLQPKPQPTKEIESFPDWCDRRYKDLPRPKICPPMMTASNQSASNQTVLDRNKRQAWLFPESVMGKMKSPTLDMALTQTLAETGRKTTDSLNATSATEPTGSQEAHDKDEAFTALNLVQPGTSQDQDSPSDFGMYAAITAIILYGLLIMGITIASCTIICIGVRDAQTAKQGPLRENSSRQRRRTLSTSTLISEVDTLKLDHLPFPPSPVKPWRP